MKAFKVTNPDSTCKGFKFEVGKRYKHKGGISLCSSGFHACILPQKCFNYYDFDPNNLVYEVEIHGKWEGNENDKIVTDDIEIIRLLSWEEVLKIVNTGTGNSGHSNSGDRNSGDKNSGNWNSGNWNSGDENSGNRNSGYRNSGDRNSGYRNSGDGNSGYRNSGNWNSGDENSGTWNSGHLNSGDRNSGYRNSGNWNSGNWNSGDRNSGYFNTDTPPIRIFGKQTEHTKINFPNYFYFDLCVWVDFSDMTDEEKAKNPNAYVCDGYLKKYDYKEAWKLAFEKASKEEIEETSKLPNFNAKMFYEITGIDYFLKNK